MDDIKSALEAIAARCEDDQNIHDSQVHLDREYLLALTGRLIAG